MAKLAITLKDLESLSPCSDRMDVVRDLIKWNGKPVSAKDARDAGVSFDDLIWVASAVAKTDKAVERRLRHWMADCAARVLHIFEKERPEDPRVRNCIQAARDYADGKITDAARAAARAAAWDAARASAR
ncbi:MAG: putative immunity protein, partial [Pseudomonadota bacterium]